MVTFRFPNKYGGLSRIIFNIFNNYVFIFFEENLAFHKPRFKTHVSIPEDVRPRLRLFVYT